MNSKKARFTIEIHSILRDLRRNIIVIIMAIMIGFMGVYIAQQSVYSPEYTSTATLIVCAKVGNSPSYTNLSISSDMAKVYAEVFVQPSMKSRAAKKLGKGSFGGTISASAIENTNILHLSVTSGNPRNSYDLLCAVLEVYPEFSEIVFENSYIDVIKMPAMAHSPSNPITKSNRLLVIFFCVLISAGVIIALSIFRDTVKSENDFKEKIDSKLVGTIVHEKKNLKPSEMLKKTKKALLINESTYLSLKFTESFHKIATKIEYANRRNGDKIFAVTSVAENEGKSTTASNIAIALASKGNRVVLFDLDEKKPALYKIFEQEYKEKAELGDLLSGKITTNEYKFRCYRKTSLFLAINTTAHKGYQQWIDSGIVEKVLSDLKEKVDYIIIDTAPLSVDSSVTDIMKIVDQTMLVVRTDVVHTSVINDAMLTIGDVGGRFFGCILNDVYPEFTLFGQSGLDEGGYYYNKKFGYGKYVRYNKYGKYNKYGSYSRYARYSKYSSYAGGGEYGGFSTGMSNFDPKNLTEEITAEEFYRDEGEIV